MLIGMGTVFVFLTLLVGATRVMSAVAQRLAPAVVSIDSANAQEADKKVVAAIAAALELHRQGARPSDD